jgi:hypothetical protein
MAGIALFVSQPAGLKCFRMNVSPRQKICRRSRFKRVGAGCFLLWLMTSALWAANGSFTNLLAQGNALEKRGDVPAALKIYAQIEESSSNNSAELCVLTKSICDLMYATRSAGVQKIWRREPWLARNRR